MSGFCIECGCNVDGEATRCPTCLPHDDPRRRPMVVDLDDEPSPRSRSASLFSALLILGIVGFLASIMVPNMIRSHARGHATACKSNMKNIGTALEMYSTDNKGLFPSRLQQLTPNYLKQVPHCTGASVDSYSLGYSVNNVRGRQAYTVVCTGLNHSGVGYSENYPQYTSTQGLLER